MASSAIRSILLAAAGALWLASAALAADFSVGERVQVFVSGGWYGATISGPVGSAPYAGYYSVHFDDGSDSYAKPDNIQAAPAPAGDGQAMQATDAEGPRPGRYTCVGFGQGQFRWYLTLGADNTYQQSRPDLAPGLWQFYPDGSVVAFDGPYGDNGWFGRFSVEAGGRHQIVLRSVASEQQGPRVKEYENIYCSNED
jgi:hypothetical protein